MGLLPILFYHNFNYFTATFISRLLYFTAISKAAAKTHPR